MYRELSKERRILEIMLIMICLGLTCMLYTMQGYKMVILNLYFLPVVLSGFFLGRYHAGVMALLCAICASLVAATQVIDMSTGASPLVIGFAIAVWAAVLGLTALLVGTLSDDRMSKMQELHEAYVGVVEVLSQYLQSAHPTLKAKSIRVAELSQQVAATMRLSPRQIDDIRVAALLYDVGDIEVTTRVIRRAVDTFEDNAPKNEPYTFQGMDLMLSLGSVLTGAVPLLLNQNQDVSKLSGTGQAGAADDSPLGAKIIRAVRAYTNLAKVTLGEAQPAPAEVVELLRRDTAGGYDPDVLSALESTVGRLEPASPAPVEEMPTRQRKEPAEAGTR